MTGQPDGTGLHDRPMRIASRRHWSWTTAAAVVAVALLAVSAVGIAAFGQSQTAEPTLRDEELVDRLVEIERSLPALPPDDVVIAEDRTWADLVGDFTGAEVGLATLEDDTRTLFAQADDTGGDVGDAVAAATRAILTLHEAYEHLADWESHDLAFPLGTVDGDGVSTGADELMAQAALGLDLVLRARALQLPAYEVLASTPAADADEKSLFEAQLAWVEAFDVELRPLILAARSDDTSQVAVVVSRFDTVAPGSEPRARSVTVTCVDRAAYEAAFESGDESDLEELLATVDPAVSADCPDLPAENAAQPGG